MAAQSVKPKKRFNIDFIRWAFHPALFFTLVFFVLPLAIIIVVSFWQRVYGKLKATWTLANYFKFFNKDYLLDALFNSIEVTLLTTIISILLAYPLAYILAYKVRVVLREYLIFLFALQDVD